MLCVEAGGIEGHRGTARLPIFGRYSCHRLNLIVQAFLFPSDIIDSNQELDNVLVLVIGRMTGVVEADRRPVVLQRQRMWATYECQRTRAPTLSGLQQGLGRKKDVLCSGVPSASSFVIYTSRILPRGRSIERRCATGHRSQIQVHEKDCSIGRSNVWQSS